MEARAFVNKVYVPDFEEYDNSNCQIDCCYSEFFECSIFSIIATPGRFLHLAVEMELKLHTIEYVVFDEADR